VLASI